MRKRRPSQRPPARRRAGRGRPAPGTRRPARAAQSSLVPAGKVGQPADRGQGAADDLTVAHRHHRVGQLFVERQAGRQQVADRIGGARQRAVGVGDPAPGLGRVDLQPDDGVAGHRRADPRREHAAAAERDRAAVVGLLQQRADHLGLALAEALLAVALEGLGDRAAEGVFHQLVDLGRRQPFAARRRQRGRLAGAHEADEDDRRLHRVLAPRALTARRSAPCRRRSRRARRRCDRRRTSRGRRAPGSGRPSPRRPPRRPGRRSSRSARAAPGRARG